LGLNMNGSQDFKIAKQRPRYNWLISIDSQQKTSQKLSIKQDNRSHTKLNRLHWNNGGNGVVNRGKVDKNCHSA